MHGLKKLRKLGFLIILLIPSFLSASTYYVDTQHAAANDNNLGTVDLPWRTIQHAAETLVAGDTVFIRNGIYNESLYIDNPGDAINGYIVFSAYPGEKPVIDGTGVSEANNGINLDKPYIKLVGLEIRNWNDTGIWIENASFIEITDCEVHNVFYGIGVADGSHDFEFNRVNVHHFNLYGFDVSPSGGADCYNGTFNDCVAHTGRDPQQNVDGFALGHGAQHDFTFNRCETYGVYDGFDVGENDGGNSTNIVFNRSSAHDCWNDGFKLTGQAKLVNCLSYNNFSSNVALYWDVNSTTSTLMNCTFFNAQTFSVWVENPADTLHMYNCILAGGDNIGLAFQQRDAGSYVGDHNVFHNDSDRAIAVGYEDEFSLNQIQSGTWTTYSGQDEHSLVAHLDSDIFFGPRALDFRLSEESIAKDQGTSVGAPSVDFVGNLRPQGEGVDIGAFEFQLKTGIGESDLINAKSKHFVLFQNYPNPFNPETTIQCELLNESLVTVEIFNVGGQRIRLLMNAQVEPRASMQLIWDGRDDLGKMVGSGIYLYRITAFSVGSENSRGHILFQDMKKMLFVK
jgi:hypothetical protein